MTITASKAAGLAMLNGGTAAGGPNPFILTPQPLMDNWWEYTTATARRYLDSTTSAQITDQDSILYHITPGSVHYDTQITIAPRGSIGTITMVSSDTDIATISGSTVQAVSDGEAVITIADGNGIRSIDLNLRVRVDGVTDIYGNSTEYDVVTAGVSGSLRKALTDSVDNRLATLDVDTDLEMFSAMPAKGVTPTSAMYTRNPNFWLSDVDLSCVATYNSIGEAGSNGSPCRAGTAISKRLVISTGHFALWSGSTETPSYIWFLGNDNILVRRAIIATLGVSPSIPCFGNFSIALLDSDLPDTVTFAKVLPKNVLTKLGYYGLSLTGLKFNQFRQVSVGTFAFDYSSGYAVPSDDWGYVGFQPSTDSQLSYRNFANVATIDKDSGSPLFFLLGQQVILLAVIDMFGGVGAKNALTYYDNINAAMSTLWTRNGCSGSAQQLTDVDISSYPLLTAL
jgi:hypothetical protein